jgi:hypothetical protein
MCMFKSLLRYIQARKALETWQGAKNAAIKPAAKQRVPNASSHMSAANARQLRTVIDGQINREMASMSADASRHQEVRENVHL